MNKHVGNEFFVPIPSYTDLDINERWEGIYANCDDIGSDRACSALDYLAQYSSFSEVDFEKQTE